MTKTEKKDPVMKGRLSDSVYENTAFKTTRSFLSYAGCIGIALAVMYFLDGTAGVILTAALICAFVISIVMTLAVMRSITVTLTADRTALSKGDDAVMTAALSKTLILPAPVVEIYTDATPQLELSGTLYKAAVAGRETNRIKIPIKALHSGACEFRITRIALTDYLGIFTFRLKLSEEQSRVKMSVYPDIPDAAVQTDFLKTTTQFQSNDDDDEESDENSITPTGMPGYDHRQYVPGDPLKRINWKLSSKRDIYMIRLDEQIRGAGQMFFLDCQPCEEDDRILTVRDTVIEGMLTMLTMLVREGREATFFYCKEGLWLSADIHDNSDIFRLQEQLGEYTPCEAPSLIPPEITAAGKTPICFTAAYAENQGSAAQIAAQAPEGLIICALSSGLQGISPNLWTISQEYEFKKATV